MKDALDLDARATPASRTHRLATLPEEERTQLIFRAASDLFAVHGYVGTSMREIADALEVRAPSLYTYFGSKQDLLDALALRIVGDGIAELRVALLVEQALPDRFRDAVRCQVLYRLEHSTALVAVTRSIEQLSPRVRERVIELRTDYFELWEGLVRDGVAEGCFAVADPHVSALVLNDLCNYVQVTVLSEEQKRKPEDLVTLFAGLALKIVAV